MSKLITIRGETDPEPDAAPEPGPEAWALHVLTARPTRSARRRAPSARLVTVNLANRDR